MQTNAESRGARNDGFTLIELLVVVSVIALLLGILLPSMRWSREVAQSMVGASNTRQLTMGQLAYASENDGWIPGPNTSGIPAKATNGANIVGGTSDTTPTSTHDWICPALGAGLGLSPNRAERTKGVFEKFACPKAVFPYTTLYTQGAGNTDLADFSDLMTREPFLQLSYLSPASFHYVSPSSQWKRSYNGIGTSAYAGFNTPFAVPVSYRPRIDLIKGASTKAAVADGTRYVLYQGGRNPRVVFDFDVSPVPSIYGSFLASGPIFHRSVEYGRGYSGTATQHIDLSMRYFGKNNEMHVAYWDGHADRISAKEAWSNPVPWYPRGSKFKVAESTPEVVNLMEMDEELP